MDVVVSACEAGRTLRSQDLIAEDLRLTGGAVIGLGTGTAASKAVRLCGNVLDNVPTA
jgi:hypothetical protein